MKKNDVAQIVASKVGLSTKQSLDAIDAVFEAIEQALLDGEVVKINGFGRFATRHRPAKQCRDIYRDKPIFVPEHRTPCFIPGNTLKRKFKE